MRSEQQRADMKTGSKRGFIPLQEEYLSSIMDFRAAVNHNRNINGQTQIPSSSSSSSALTEGGNRTEYFRKRSSSGFSQGPGKRIFSASYFSIESMLLLVCLTASLLLLPLILPPLPPPPFMLLLVPICIFGLLMVLAFMPYSNVRGDHVANTTTTNTSYTCL